MKISLIVTLLSVLLSVATAQTCNPSTGMACSPGNCCPGFQRCSGTTFYPLQATAAGTVCKDGAITWASDCAGIPCQGNPSLPTPPPVAATTKPVSPTAQPTPSPTWAPWTPPSTAPSTPSPTWAPWTPPSTAPSTPSPTWAPPPPTPAPTAWPTWAPWTPPPTASPTAAPSWAPSPPTAAPTRAPTTAPTAAPTNAPPATAAPTLSPGGGGNGGNGGSATGFGQLLMAYYSGVALDTVGSGGLNALAMAFFDPTPLGSGTCDFTDLNTPCIIPAAGSGGSKNLAWAMNVFTQATPQLSANTAPVPGGKPTIYFSFGGQSQGGACWDTLFGSASTATTFGTNAAKLVTTVSNTLAQNGIHVYVGFDLDVEGTSTALPYISNFISAFRAIASYDTYPLQLCSLSGLADPLNDDYFKIGIMREVGPAQRGINFLNMMVANVDVSCSGMQAYWMADALQFIPPANKIFGMWGELLPSWILHEPGCTTGSTPLFTMMKQNGVGIGIWQWWSGATTEVAAVISQIRS